MLFRSLADAEWEVSAAAYRRIKTFPDEVPSPSVFQNYVKQLLNDTSLRGFREQKGKRHSDLELLAELQHNGAATCLIDFTTNSLIALWFACQEEPGKEGKVVAMPTDKIELFSTVSYQQMEKPVEYFLREEDKDSPLEENKLWKWTPEHMSNRIVAQQSVFVFGRGKIEQTHYKEVMIDRDRKEGIRSELREKFGITEQHLFSDFTGFALSNAHDKPYSDYTAVEHLKLGMEFHQRGDLEKAIDAYNKATECNPQFFKAYYNRGIAKYGLGDYPRAITDYDVAVEINSQDAEVYYNRGFAKHKMGDHKGAIADYDMAVGIDPQYADAYNTRGIAKHALGDYHGAIVEFDKAIEINPQHAMAYTNRGLSSADLGDYPGAIADHDKAIEFNPGYSDAHSN